MLLRWYSRVHDICFNTPIRIYPVRRNTSSLVENDAKLASQYLVSPFWSLQELADMQTNFTNESQEVFQPKKISSAFGSAAGFRKQTNITSEVARNLVDQVKYRLAVQHDLCSQMKQHAVNPLSPSPIFSIKNDGESKKKIIRAVNSPVVEQTPSLQKTKEVLHILNDLKKLHYHTHKLVNDITSSVILERFSVPDRFLVASTMEQIQARHANTIENLVEIILLLRNETKDHTWIEKHFLDKFLYERARIILLCDHYIALDRHKPSPLQNQYSRKGVVHLDCPIHDVLQDAILEASHLCDANLGLAPEIIILDEDLLHGTKLSLIRSWVHYALVELLKNAMASSVEKHQRSSESISPSIVYVKVVRSQQKSIEFEILDQGLGLQSSASIEKAWRFASSGIEERWCRLKEQQSYAMVRSPLQSLGVGLTLSRMMMRMFGGDITLSSRPKNTIITNTETLPDKTVSRKHLCLDSGCTATIRLNGDITFRQEDERQNI